MEAMVFGSGSEDGCISRAERDENNQIIARTLFIVGGSIFAVAFGLAAAELQMTMQARGGISLASFVSGTVAYKGIKG